MTKEQFLNENKEYLDFESTLLFFNLIDLRPYENEEGGVNPTKINKKIKNIVLNKMNNSVILSNGQNKNCEHQIHLC
jgi:hypothetical protein